MTNTEIVNEVLEKLEKNHLNLYHSVTKKEVERFVGGRNWDSFDRKDFDYNMLKLFSKFDDAQTKWYIKYKAIDKIFEFVQGKVYVKVEGIYKEVLAIGGMDIKSLIKELRSLLAYESEENFAMTFRDALGNGYYYELLGLVNGDRFSINIDDCGEQKEIIANIIGRQATMRSLRKNYEYKVLENNILYVRYRKCTNDVNYPFKEFVEDIRKEIVDKSITNYILDVRNNKGGNSEVINPLCELIVEKCLKGVILIDGLVFGAPLFTIARLKQRCDICLVGENTGGSNKRYGDTKNLNVEDYFFSVSTKLFDFSEVFGYKGAIRPDIYVPATIEDIQNQKDTQLETALKYFNN